MPPFGPFGFASVEKDSNAERLRLRQLKGLLEKNAPSVPATILLYGCGSGETLPLLREIFPLSELVGTDRAEGSMEAAQQKKLDSKISFLNEKEIADRKFDLVLCSNLFHHIKPQERPPILEFIRDHVKEGGHFAFIENNPWKFQLRRAVQKNGADSPAMKISPSKAIRLLESQGFQWIVIHNLFHLSRWLRFLEIFLGRLPLGAHYVVLTRVNPVFYT